MEGFGLYSMQEGRQYLGEFQDNNRDGVGVQKFSDGRGIFGTWEGGSQNGVGTFIDFN